MAKKKTKRRKLPKGRRKLLFLCVANSARSQIAEGLARKLAPKSVKVQSAGSKPTEVRPEAIAVMKEVGIDISKAESTSVADVDPKTVDTVITLCAEQVCPAFLGDAERLHWPVPDPAAAEGGEQERLDAFRRTRDALATWIVALWSVT
jgi:arsenate reductase